MSRIYKLRPDTEDMRDFSFTPSQFKAQSQLPKSIDLRPGCSPIVDQEDLGSCTANAIASGLREYWENPAGSVPLSRLWLYWEERFLEGTVNDDAGAEIRDGMKILKKMGCAPEVDWPYDTSKFTETPPEQATTDAIVYTISNYHRVTNLTNLKASLAEGYPVVLGIDVYDSFESVDTNTTGIVPMPQEGENLLGGHGVLAVGYNDNSILADKIAPIIELLEKNPKGITDLIGEENTNILITITQNIISVLDATKNTGYVICRNSWGPDWGDKGYFYLPYSYFTKYVHDMWTGK